MKPLLEQSSNRKINSYTKKSFFSNDKLHLHTTATIKKNWSYLYSLFLFTVLPSTALEKTALRNQCNSNESASISPLLMFSSF